MSVIDGATCNASVTSGCGKTPPTVSVGNDSGPVAGLAVSQATDTIYVVNTGDDTVSVINGATCNGKVTSGCDQTVPTVPVGGNPAGLAVNPNDHTVYVADNSFGPVSFLAFQPPGSPSDVTASARHGEVTLAWLRAYDGGLPIVYHVIPSPACPTRSGLTTPSTSGIPSTTISGLTPGQAYTFRVQATDAAGTGPASSPSNPVSP